MDVFTHMAEEGSSLLKEDGDYILVPSLVDEMKAYRMQQIVQSFEIQNDHYLTRFKRTDA